MVGLGFRNVADDAADNIGPCFDGLAIFIT